MKKHMYIFIATVATLLVIWTLFSYFLERSVASPSYTVLEKKDGYEIRSYEPYIMAQVEVSGPYDQAINEGFRILADYIFGNNTRQTKLSMTAPVIESADVSETLSMTAPVMESGDNQQRIVSFVMPFEYTLETLPKPNNPKVHIATQEARKVAVLPFSWLRTPGRVEQKKQELLSLLEQDKITSTHLPEYAGYNAPFHAPWLNRHEIMVEIE